MEESPWIFQYLQNTYILSLLPMLNAEVQILFSYTTEVSRQNFTDYVPIHGNKKYTLILNF